MLFDEDVFWLFGFLNCGPGLELGKGLFILLLVLLLGWFWFDFLGGKWEEVDALLLLYWLLKVWAGGNKFFILLKK